MTLRVACLLGLFAPVWVLGCQSAAQRPTTTLLAATAPSEGGIRLVSVGERAGIRFELSHHGKSPLTILETGGAGAAFLDFDRDSWPDALLVGPKNLALYHNRRDSTFEDVTAGSGLRKDREWMGCAVGDYDADGLPDVFLTGYRCFALYRNAGGGNFQDVTQQSGITGLPWSMSAAFADFDGDGDLDLFVSQYLEFDEKTPQVCALGSIRSACGPEIYEPISGRLFLNDGHGRFGAAAGWKDTGKTWGALASRLTGGRTPDLYLANDMVPGDLWGAANGKWVNRGSDSGTAYDAEGHLQGGMGVDSADYDNDGKLDLLVTTFFAQPVSLYHNDGGGLFTVTSGPTGLGAPTMPFVGFGVVFSDLDNDGWQDVVITNGHVRDNVAQFDRAQQYEQPMQIFRNREGHFEDVTAGAFGGPPPSLVGRGLAIGDYNKDGGPDLLVANLEGSALLLENQSRSGHWLDVRLRGARGNRDGLNALVRVDAGGTKRLREIRTGGSVLSACEPVAHFGLGDYSGPVSVTVEWLDGAQQTQAVPAVDRAIEVKVAR